MLHTQHALDAKTPFYIGIQNLLALLGPLSWGVSFRIKKRFYLCFHTIFCIHTWTKSHKESSATVFWATEIIFFKKNPGNLYASVALRELFFSTFSNGNKIHLWFAAINSWPYCIIICGQKGTFAVFNVSWIQNVFLHLEIKKGSLLVLDLHEDPDPQPLYYFFL